MQRANRFKATYASLGLTVADVGKLLHVTPRTLHNWIAGRCDIPYAAFKLLRVLLCYELPSPAWEGWHFSAGKLYTPEGRSIAAHESSWWSLLVRQAQSSGLLYWENVELRRQLAAAVDGKRSAAPAAASSSELRNLLVDLAMDGGLGARETPVTPHFSLTGETFTPNRPDFRVRYTLAAGGA